MATWIILIYAIGFAILFPFFTQYTSQSKDFGESWMKLSLMIGLTWPLFILLCLTYKLTKNLRESETDDINEPTSDRDL